MTGPWPLLSGGSNTWVKAPSRGFSSRMRCRAASTCMRILNTKAQRRHPRRPASAPFPRSSGGLAPAGRTGRRSRPGGRRSRRKPAGESHLRATTAASGGPPDAACAGVPPPRRVQARRGGDAHVGRDRGLSDRSSNTRPRRSCPNQPLTEIVQSSIRRTRSAVHSPVPSHGRALGQRPSGGGNGRAGTGEGGYLAGPGLPRWRRPARQGRNAASVKTRAYRALLTNVRAERQSESKRYSQQFSRTPAGAPPPSPSPLRRGRNGA
jgi:hypothetical protein